MPERMLNLSRSEGPVSNTALTPWTISFEDLCNEWSRKPPIGQKNGSNFIRGPFRTEYPIRADANIESASLVVLDGDSSIDPQTGEETPGAPDPESVHKVLAGLNIQHLIYTSHSHGIKGNRYRVLIPAVVPDKKTLSACVEWLIDQLHQADVWLADVKENHSWSQSWYLPRIQSKESEYLFYHHDEGSLDVSGCVKWKQRQDADTTKRQEAIQALAILDANSPIGRYNAKYGNPDAMLKRLNSHGYATRSIRKRKNDNGGNMVEARLLFPGSMSGEPGVKLVPGKSGKWVVFSHHSHDPLGPNEVGNCLPRDAFDLFRILAHDGVMEKALAAWQADAFMGLVPACIEQGSCSSENRPRTDIGNVERFLDLTRGRVRYVTGLATWLMWDGRRWDLIDDVFPVVKAVIRSIYSEASNVGDENLQASLHKWAKTSESFRQVNALTALVQRSPEVKLNATELDCCPTLIGCQNGVIDLGSGSLIKPDMGQYITKSLDASFSSDAQCPRWERFIDDVTGGNQELASYLQRLAGYALHGGNPEQKVSILHGTGSNGKSVFLGLLQAVFGDYSRMIDPNSLMSHRGGNGGGPREDLVRLYRARLAVSLESADGDRLDEGLIKAMSGEDLITARGVHSRRSIEFNPEFLLLLGTNHKPVIRGTDHAIWRRLALIPFEQTFDGDNGDKHLLPKLLAERDGVLRWLVKGYGLWADAGLGAPQIVNTATAEYKRDQDILQDWIDDRCHVGENYKRVQSTLYSSYSQWCNESGHRPLSNNRFGRQLAVKGFKKKRDKSSENRDQILRLGIDVAARAFSPVVSEAEDIKTLLQ